MEGIFDQYGTPWLVEKTDPAAGAIRRLKSLGYRYIVLPAAVIMGGVEAASKSPFIEKPFEMPRDAVDRSARYNDCLAALSGGEIEESIEGEDTSHD